MTPPTPLIIDAVVRSMERPAHGAAARQLQIALSTATGSEFPITLRFNDSLATIDPGAGRAIIVASLLVEIPGREESVSQTEARWRDQLSSLVQTAAAPVFLCTIFRHVANRESPAIIERIRRLNLMAARLSHDTGVAVVDIDRVFAYFGARLLETDYRLGGALAAELAGYTVVASILAAGLDDIVPPEIQERAQKVQGDMLKRLSSDVSW